MSKDSEIEQLLMLQGAIAFMPNLVKMYPQLLSLVEMVQKGIEDYLGDNDKMVVAIRKNGKTMAIVLDPKKEFTISNEVKLEAKEDPTLNVYEMNEWKQKLLNSTIALSLKEKYEKLVESGEVNSEANVADLLKTV